MKKTLITACVATLFQIAAVAPLYAQEAVGPSTQAPSAQPPSPSIAAPQTPNEIMPNIDRMPVARPSQAQDDLEGRGLLRSAIGSSPDASAIVSQQNGSVISVPGQQVVGTETVVESAVGAPVIPVTKKLMVVPPMIVDLMMGDAIVIGPRFDYGFGPGLPLDEISMLPEMRVQSGHCISMPVPEACVLRAGEELSGVLLIGRHMQRVTVELTEPCVMTVTLPQIWMSTEMRATLLVGLNTGDVLYEQPMLMTLPQG